MDDPVNHYEATLTVANARPEFERASRWLGNLSASAGLAKDVTASLQVALDEVLSNIMTHSFVGSLDGRREIGLRLRIYPDNVELEIRDDGPAFDPTGVVPAPRATRVVERQEGGVGLLFVRTLVDELRFTRHGGVNCLTLYKRLAATA
jgi:serine/threonine-protein kinase RsbW